MRKEDEPAGPARTGPVDPIQRLSRRLDALEENLRQQTGRTSEDEEDRANNDRPWPCGKCGRYLGWYDATSDTLRVRHRGLVLYVRLGTGGSMNMVCWGCAAVNTQEWVPEVPK